MSNSRKMLNPVLKPLFKLFLKLERQSQKEDMLTEMG